MLKLKLECYTTSMEKQCIFLKCLVSLSLINVALEIYNEEQKFRNFSDSCLLTFGYKTIFQILIQFCVLEKKCSTTNLSTTTIKAMQNFFISVMFLQYFRKISTIKVEG